MGRAGILDGQSHAAKVLIKLFKTGLPPMVLHITDSAYVMGSPAAGTSDRKSYTTMAHCAERLGMQLQVIPPRAYWQSTSSDEEHSNLVLVTPRNEKYVIEGVYHGVKLWCTASALEGTAKKTYVPKFQRARSRDPVVTAQLQALRAMIGLLSADLPPLSWRLYPENCEPRLTPEINTYQRRREARAELAQWADFLGTSIGYDPSSRYRFLYNSAEVTGQVDGVPITITARLRCPLSGTRPWQALRRLLTRTNKSTIA